MAVSRNDGVTPSVGHPLASPLRFETGSTGPRGSFL
jgi:hypothetical protein